LSGRFCEEITVKGENSTPCPKSNDAALRIYAKELLIDCSLALSNRKSQDKCPLVRIPPRRLPAREDRVVVRAPRHRAAFGDNWAAGVGGLFDLGVVDAVPAGRWYITDPTLDEDGNVTDPGVKGDYALINVRTRQPDLQSFIARFSAEDPGTQPANIPDSETIAKGLHRVDETQISSPERVWATV